MPFNAVIVDFDCTLTKKHTFRERSIDSPEVSYNLLERIEQGYIEALTNLKEEIPETLYAMSSTRICAIATFHNNPDYVAGYFMRLSKLKQDDMPTLVMTTLDSEKGIAINTYYFEALVQPLYIAYILGGKTQVNTLTEKLSGKNEMLVFIMKIWQEKELIPDEPIDFYDDTTANIGWLRESFWVERLKLVRGFLVEREQPKFGIKKTVRFALHYPDYEALPDTPRLGEQAAAPETKLVFNPEIYSVLPDTPRTPHKPLSPTGASHTPRAGTALLEVPQSIARQPLRGIFFPALPAVCESVPTSVSAGPENQQGSSALVVSIDLSEPRSSEPEAFETSTETEIKHSSCTN